MKGKQYLNVNDVVTFGHLGGHAVAPGQLAPKQPAEFQFVVSFICILLAFSALTLLVGCQEGHPAHKNLTDEVLGYWHGYL